MRAYIYIFRFDDGLVHGHVVHGAKLHQVVDDLIVAGVGRLAAGHPFKRNAVLCNHGSVQVFDGAGNAFAACGGARETETNVQ